MEHIWKILRTILVWAICLMSLCPFVILLILSLDQPGKNMYDIQALIPDFYLGNYAEGWQKSNISRAMLNSGIITFSSLIMIVVLGAMAGYAVARIPSKFNKTVYGICKHE